jgi:acetylornithine/N-succinyldiaminopimelate aminotransferase
VSESESESDQLRHRFEAAMMGNYGTPPLALARGAGSHVWDADGNRYLDLIGGIAVSALGHAHPAIVRAVTAQVAKIAHTSNLFLHEPGVLLAEKIQSLLHAEARVFFCNSGTEANEAALKLVRRAQGKGRPVMVAADHGFHGRTMGALAVTGKESIRAPFEPFGFDVRWVEYGDAAALANAVDDQVAGVILEPTLGESGVIPAPAGYLAAARRACDEAGALFILDEIQSGFGRTGAWFAHQSEGFTPDVLTLAKGLGGGLPIGACVGFGAAGSALHAGDHGSTFGGNPIACAAALAVIDTIESQDLLKNVKSVGESLASGIAAIEHPLLGSVRGSGLWLGAVLTADQAPAVNAAAREAGFLVNAVQPNVVRLAPPLILTHDEAAQFVTALPGILTRATTGLASATTGLASATTGLASAMTRPEA